MPFYLDVNSTSPQTRPVVKDAESVLQSLRNLLNTRRGEIPFLPRYGIDIEEKLFDLQDDATRLEILSDVFDAVDEFEPRVKLRRGQSSVELFPEDNQIQVSLDFTIEGFEDNGVFTLTETFTR